MKSTKIFEALMYLLRMNEECLDATDCPLNLVDIIGHFESEEFENTVGELTNKQQLITVHMFEDETGVTIF